MKIYNCRCRKCDGIIAIFNTTVPSLIRGYSISFEKHPHCAGRTEGLGESVRADIISESTDFIPGTVDFVRYFKEFDQEYYMKSKKTENMTEEAARAWLAAHPGDPEDDPET